MPDYDNELSGALFKNDRKTKDAQPDYTGECQIDGISLWVSAWIKTSRAGKTYMSLAFTKKDTDAAAGSPQPPAPAASPSANQPPPSPPPEDIPF